MGQLYQLLGLKMLGMGLLRGLHGMCLQLGLLGQLLWLHGGLLQLWWGLLTQ